MVLLHHFYAISHWSMWDFISGHLIPFELSYCLIKRLVRNMDIPIHCSLDARMTQKRL